jgi:hypothetical protein
MPQSGETIPHFGVSTTAGTRFEYRTIWQRYHLVLVALPVSGFDDYASEIERFTDRFRQADAVLVVTREPIQDLVAPMALVADRWGEIMYFATFERGQARPTPAELLEWVEYVGRRCPECEGEYR